MLVTKELFTSIMIQQPSKAQSTGRYYRRVDQICLYIRFQPFVFWHEHLSYQPRSQAFEFEYVRTLSGPALWFFFYHKFFSIRGFFLKIAHSFLHSFNHSATMCQKHVFFNIEKSHKNSADAQPKMME